MSILQSLKTLFGIGLMKTDKALKASIDSIDEVELAISNEEEQLDKANQALLQTRKSYLKEIDSIDSAKKSLVELEQKANATVLNLRRKGLSDEEIAIKVQEISVDMTRSIERLKNTINSKTPIAEQLKTSISTFEENIQKMENSIKNNKNQVSILRTNIEVAKTSKMIAGSNTALNAGSSSAAIEKAKELVKDTEAEATAMLQQANFRQSGESKLDQLYLDSLSGNDNNPFAKILNLGAPEATDPKLLKE